MKRYRTQKITGLVHGKEVVLNSNRTQELIFPVVVRPPLLLLPNSLYDHPGPGARVDVNTCTDT